VRGRANISCCDILQTCKGEVYPIVKTKISPR
jgi:hypothetical protein